MIFVEDNNGMFGGESCLVPECSVCGCRRLFEQKSGVLRRLKKCPDCNCDVAIGICADEGGFNGSDDF